MARRLPKRFGPPPRPFLPVELHHVLVPIPTSAQHAQQKRGLPIPGPGPSTMLHRARLAALGEASGPGPGPGVGAGRIHDKWPNPYLGAWSDVPVNSTTAAAALPRGGYAGIGHGNGHFGDAGRALPGSQSQTQTQTQTQTLSETEEGVESRRVPFFRDPGHTGPTLRLYRALWRALGPGPRLQPRLRSGTEAGSGAAQDSLQTEAKAEGKRKGKTKGASENMQEAEQAASLSAPTPSASSPSPPSLAHEDTATSISYPSTPPSSSPFPLPAPSLASRPSTLSRSSPRQRLQHAWRRTRHLTSIPRARSFLSTQYDLLSILESSSSPSASASPSASRSAFPSTSHPSLSHLLLHHSLPPLPRIRPRHPVPEPIYHLQGSFLRPSPFITALPRLTPQPLGISMMIARRIAQKQRQTERRRELIGLKREMQLESAFWRGLGEGACAQAQTQTQTRERPRLIRPIGIGAGAPAPLPRANTRHREPRALGVWDGGWDGAISDAIAAIEGTFARAGKRDKAVFGVGVYGRVMRAKERREGRTREWRERERERERRKDMGA